MLQNVQYSRTLAQKKAVISHTFLRKCFYSDGVAGNAFDIKPIIPPLKKEHVPQIWEGSRKPSWVENRSAEFGASRLNHISLANVIIMLDITLPSIRSTGGNP